MRKNYTTEQLDAIVADKLLFGLPTKEISEKRGFSRAFIDATVATYRHVRDGNWDKIRFMLDGAQMQLKTVEWAAAKCGVDVPASFYAPEQEDESQIIPQTEEAKSIGLVMTDATNRTFHALIDALKVNANEAAQLRKAIFALLNTSAGAD